MQLLFYIHGKTSMRQRQAKSCHVYQAITLRIGTSHSPPEEPLANHSHCFPDLGRLHGQAVDELFQHFRHHWQQVGEWTLTVNVAMQLSDIHNEMLCSIYHGGNSIWVDVL